MVPGRLILALAALSGAFPLACAHAAPPPLAPEPDPVMVLGGDVPLVAPDEQVAATSRPRLRATRTLGGGDDQSYVLDDASRVGARNLATTSPPPSTLRTTGYVRGGGGFYGAGRGVTPAGPAVGGNFPAAPSSGPRAAR